MDAMDEQEERDREEPGDAIEDLDVDQEAAEQVGGGLSPPSPPSGPVPIPYPNRR
jgi:hypothetical protein